MQRSPLARRSSNIVSAASVCRGRRRDGWGKWADPSARSVGEPYFAVERAARSLLWLFVRFLLLPFCFVLSFFRVLFYLFDFSFLVLLGYYSKRARVTHASGVASGARPQ